MFYKNARIFCEDQTFRTGAFEVTEEGTFGAILPQNVPADAIDLKGATVIPGLVDVHIHGAMGSDFSDGDYEGLVAMCRYLAKEGITSVAPASMTLPYDVLEKAFANGRKVADNRPDGCARLVGVHMEGPYFSEKKKGAQNGDYLKNPDFEGFRALYEGCNGLVRIVDLAPELPGSEEFIEKAKGLCTVSVAHTDASYEDAAVAFRAGATHLTHLYNAMPSIHHRNPGVIPAAVENENVRAELICDGLHAHPGAVRLAFTMFGKERMVLVSDAVRCCGLPDGEYELGGQAIFLAGGIAKLASGTIAGSATNLYKCMCLAIQFGIPEEDALRAATYNPACALGLQDKIGTISSGKHADFMVCSPDYTEKTVYIGGKAI